MIYKELVLVLLFLVFKQNLVLISLSSQILYLLLELFYNRHVLKLQRRPGRRLALVVFNFHFEADNLLLFAGKLFLISLNNLNILLVLLAELLNATIVPAFVF